jgi:hypothetical protein
MTTTALPQRASGIYVFSKTDKFNAQVIQFVEYFQKVAHTSGYSIERGDKNDVEPVPAGICQEFVKARTFRILRRKLYLCNHTRFHIRAAWPSNP